MAVERCVPKTKGISLMPKVLEANKAVKYKVKAMNILLFIKWSGGEEGPPTPS